MQPPLKHHCFAAHAEVYSVKKNAYTRLSLSLSLSPSLSPPLEKRARGEVGGSWPWLGPTTPAVISNHPGYHMGTMSDVYRADGRVDVYPADACRVAASIRRVHIHPAAVRRVHIEPTA